ncbi:hypothetical protein L249_4806, partial [Ophiocordyceps polyrhachis-furcata BCC 54312]
MSPEGAEYINLLRGVLPAFVLVAITSCWAPETKLRQRTFWAQIIPLWQVLHSRLDIHCMPDGMETAEVGLFVRALDLLEGLLTCCLFAATSRTLPSSCRMRQTPVAASIDFIASYNRHSSKWIRGTFSMDSDQWAISPSSSAAGFLCDKIQEGLDEHYFFTKDHGGIVTDYRRAQHQISLSKAELIPLTEGLLETSPLVPLKHRVCLSVVLAHMALNTMGNIWHPTPKNKQGLYFLQEDVRMRLLPVLHTCLETSDTSSPDFNTLLLALGVLLLEIFCQKSLDLGSDLASAYQSRISMASKHQHARKLALLQCSATSWDVNEPFREAVRACLEGITDPCASDAETCFVSFLLSKVIAPLEVELGCFWGDEE